MSTSHPSTAISDHRPTEDRTAPGSFVERAARRVDAFQQRRPVVGFPVAVFKKFGDDQGSRLAALVAYYGFFSLFPLLLVLVSVLGFVLSGDPSLRHDIVDSALGQFPVIGNQLRSGSGVSGGLQGNWVSIVVGGATAVWAGLGVAQAAQDAMNTVWDVPRSVWPNFLHRRLRALALLALLGLIVIASTFVSGYGSSGSASFGAWSGWFLALLLNLVLFLVSYHVLTAEALAWRDVLPGAAAAAVLWTALQAAGGYVVTHQIRSSSDVYGTFALVLALFVWISLGAQIMLLCAEINVVRRRRLWPRSLVQPPLTEGDERVYRGVVERARMRPEIAVRTWFTRNHAKERRGRDGAGSDDRTPPEQRVADPWDV